MAAVANKAAPRARRLVIGMGQTGYSVVRHLCRAGEAVCVADSRDFPPYLQLIKQEFPTVEVVTGRIPYARFDRYDEVVVSPGIALEPGAVADNHALVGDIELFARRVCAPVIGITGSNGKSTVTMLVTEMLKAAGYAVQTGGNIGTPALDLLEQAVPHFYVLELSSFQLETTRSLALAAATVLNISEDHLDRYHQLSAYIAAKARIYRHAECAVVNADDTHAPPPPPGMRMLRFGLGRPVTNEDFGLVTDNSQTTLRHGTRVLGKGEDLVRPGRQQLANTLAALALVHAVGVPVTAEVVQAGLRFGGLPHRCEPVAEIAGVRWINDSKATNVGATVAALDGMTDGRRGALVLIAGGQGKGADFAPLGRAIHQAVSHTILFGEDAQKIAATLVAGDSYETVTSLEQAVMAALACSRSGAVVLFSPACASFDMFDDYAHRGRVFRQLVQEQVQ